MKKILFLFLSFSFLWSTAQEKEQSKKGSYIQLENFYGNILKHQPNVAPLILGHPSGFILSWNQRNYGNQAWEHRYNYPDFGVSFSYQDYKNKILGSLYAIYGHYNFYLFNRHAKNKLIFRAGIGLAYNTHPYDKVNNNKNVAFGTRLNSSTYFKLYYQREHLFDKLGLQAGFTFIHASNSSIKAPNTGINTWGVTAGINYDLEDKPQEFHLNSETKKFKEKIRFNAVFRTGVNESDYIGTGTKPFFTLSGYADKRLNIKSSIQLGTDVFLTYFLKEHIKLQRIIDGEDLTQKAPDWKRVGVFVGHELFINKISIVAQLGYYVYSPYFYESNVYERLGIKRYFNNNLFAMVSLKAHAANAENVAFAVGYRFN